MLTVADFLPPRVLSKYQCVLCPPVPVLRALSSAQPLLPDPALCPPRQLPSEGSAVCLLLCPTDGHPFQFAVCAPPASEARAFSRLQQSFFPTKACPDVSPHVFLLDALDTLGISAHFLKYFLLSCTHPALGTLRARMLYPPGRSGVPRLCPGLFFNVCFLCTHWVL